MEEQESVAFGEVYFPGGLLGAEPSVGSQPSLAILDGEQSVPRRPPAAQRMSRPGVRIRAQYEPQNVPTSTRERHTELNGASYSLSVAGHRGTYLMPSTENEKSADRNIDVWPAVSATDPAAGLARSFMQQRVRGAASKPTSKPKLLEKIERFIRDEFSALAIDRSQGPSRATLQVYREAFDMFTAQFRAYKPLLLSIKHEYELLIEKYAARLRCLPALEGRLATLEERHAHEMDALRRGHREACAALAQRLIETEARAI